jgi:hypothetical protein
MNPVQMVRRTYRGAVVLRIASAVRAERYVVIVQTPP